MLGALFAVLSALSFSTNAVLVRRGVTQASPSQGAFITVMIGVPLFFVAALAAGQLLRAGDLPASSYGLLAFAGIIHFILGRSLNYRAIAAVGAARTAPIQALTIPYSILIALIFLDESITLGMAAGIGLIMVGPAIMVERSGRRPAAAPAPAASVAAAIPAASEPVAPAAAAIPTEPVAAAAAATKPGFELRQVEGYVSALLAAMVYGTTPILIRAALEGESGLSILGGLAAYSAAAALLLVSVLLPGRRGLLATMRPATIRLFLGAGFSVFLAQMFRFIALSLAPVAVVTTLGRAGSVFTLGLSWLLNRDLEQITARVVIGVGFSVSGAVLLVATRVS